MRAPAETQIPAPEFPSGIEWLNSPFVRVDKLLGRHALMVEFWDFARVNSLRTIPYLRAWHERYSEAGLAVVGVHSPGYSFGRDAAAVARAVRRAAIHYPVGRPPGCSFGGDAATGARAVERLEIDCPVALDPDFEVWRAYSVPGWPARYLFDRLGLLRWFHFGEGDYDGTEQAIQEVLLEIEPD